MKMKLSLRQKEYLSAVISAAGFVILFLVKAEWRKTVGVLLLITGMVIMCLWLRCPKCGKTFYNRRAKVCKRCGTPIDWHAK